MIGLVLVTHGGIGEQLCAAVEHVLGPQRQLAFVSVDGADSMSLKQAEIAAAIESVRPARDEGVIVLTDMIGCTPSNLASREGQRGREVVVTGVNLPMLVTMVKVRERGALMNVVDKGIKAGRKYIDIACTPATVGA